MRNLEHSIRASMTVTRLRHPREASRAPRHSPLHELRRRSIGSLDLFGQSVSAVAPSAAGASIPATIFVIAGHASLLALIIGFTITALIVGTIAQYARRMVTSGSVYSYVAWAGGTRTGTAAGAALIVGGLAITVGVLAGTALTASALLQFALPALTSWIWDPIFIALIAALGFTLFALGVRFSTRITLIVEAVAIVIIVVIMTIVIVTNWGALPPIAPEVVDPIAIGAGAAMAVGLFVGFETSATLGSEARRPFRDVPRSFVLTVVIAGVIFLLSFAGQYAGLHTLAGLTGDGQIDPTASGSSTGLVVVMEVGILLSYLAAFVASLNGVIRVAFTLAKDGLVPRSLTQVDRTNALPMRAAVALTIVVFVLALTGTLLSNNPLTVVGTALTVAALGYGLSYALACLVLPRFRRTIGEPLLAASVVGYGVGAALLVSLFCFVTWKVINGEALVVAVPLTLIAVLWWGFAVIARRRGPAEPLGVYDQTSQRELAPASVETHFDSGPLRYPKH